MIRNGMNIARINFAHGDFEGHRKTIANVRATAKAVRRRVAIFGDLPGPKMRIGKLVEEPIELERGHSFVLQTEEITGNQQRVSMDFAGLPKVVKPGDIIVSRIFWRFVKPPPHLTKMLATTEARSRHIHDLLQHQGVDHGLVMRIERSDTIQAGDTKRIDIIDLG
jgi:hypothetical protein